MSNERNTLLLRTPKLTRARRLVVYGTTLMVWLTGAVWVVLHYFFMQNGPFGPTPSPIEFYSLVAHGAAAFASLWLFGLLWGIHVPIGWNSSRRRWSGGTMFAITTWLILSGYMLYYIGTEEFMSVVGVLHWSIGLAAPAVFLLHRFAREQRRLVAQPVPDFEFGMRRGDR